MFANLPVTALRTFESAARLRSFKLAAAELAVTPTAVSHQVKALEQRVGVALFERVPRGVRLTERGASLFAGVHGALLDIAQTLDALRPAPDTGALTVSTTHSFAALWLVPRLGRFHQAYPQYQLRLDASARPVDLLQDASVDVAIRYSQKRYPALIAACSLPESFGVYGAPVLAARLGGRAPAGSARAGHVRWRDSRLCMTRLAAMVRGGRPAALAQARRHPCLRGRTLRAAGGHRRPGPGAGQLGHGVRQRPAGALAPLRPEVRVPGAAYTALCAPGRERHPPARAFLDWLAREFEA